MDEWIDECRGEGGDYSGHERNNDNMQTSD
jgi:hypothetical protein